MIPRPPVLRNVVRSRSLPVLLLGVAVLVAGSIGVPATSRSQGGGGGVALNADAFTALIGQIRKQQEQIAANQTKLETQIAAAKEEVRQVKIYSGRTGGGATRR